MRPHRGGTAETCRTWPDQNQAKPGLHIPLHAPHHCLHAKAPTLWLCRQRCTWGTSRWSDLGGATSSVQKTNPAWMGGKKSPVALHPSWNWPQGREQQVATEWWWVGTRVDPGRKRICFSVRETAQDWVLSLPMPCPGPKDKQDRAGEQQHPFHPFSHPGHILVGAPCARSLPC